MIKFCAFFVDAKNADMSDMVVAAGVDATGDFDFKFADIILPVEIRKPVGNFLRQRY